MKKAVDEFKELLEVTERLMGPQGCPWDHEQTLMTIRHSILEEACEVIDAINEKDPHNLLEELGDLFYNVIFFSKLAEKENWFELQKVIFMIKEKLIARHPHVFGDVVLHNAEAAILQWEKLKSAEHNKQSRKSILDGIPKSLPILFRSYKLIAKMNKKKELSILEDTPDFKNEEELGELLWKITIKAKKMGVNPEIALRKIAVQKEKSFRKWENQNDKVADS